MDSYYQGWIQRHIFGGGHGGIWPNFRHVASRFEASRRVLTFVELFKLTFEMLYLQKIGR